MNTTTISRFARKAFHSHLPRRRAQAGLTLLELALVLLVGAILIAGAVLLYSQNLRSTSINANVQAIQSISGKIKQKYGVLGQYGDITTANAAQNGIFGDLRVVGSNTAVTPFSTQITVAPATLSATNDSVLLTWPGTPSAQCSDIVVGVQSALRQISVGNTEVKALDTRAVDITALGAACEAADTVTLQMWVGRS
jgi:Tfp pilus assembly protein PilE